MARGGDEVITFEGRKVGPRTAKAELIEVNGREEWLPRSQTVDVFGPYGDDMDLFEFHVTEWWAKRNGLA